MDIMSNLRTLEAEYIVAASDPDFEDKAKRCLETLGVVVLRGLLSDTALDALTAKTKKILARPALGGSIGYYQKDPNKKLFDCFLLGSEAIAALTHKKMVTVLDQFFGLDVVMTEGFVKHDLGNNRSYFPYHSHTGMDLDKREGEVFSTGVMVYLHDTEVGAFCYSPGTHKLNSPHGADPYTYAEPLRSQILDGMRRIAGLRGDFVIFDGRGFHGPEQPVTVPRTVLLTAYSPIAYCRDGAIKNGQPICITDLTGLDAQQLRVLGVGMKAAQPLEKFHAYGFNRTRGYRFLTRAFDAWWVLVATVARVKDILRGLRGRKVAYDAADA
jgi:hypothetical protein